MSACLGLALNKLLEAANDLPDEEIQRMRPTSENLKNTDRLLKAMAEHARWKLDLTVNPQEAATAAGLTFTRNQLSEMEDRVCTSGLLGCQRWHAWS